MKITFIVTGKTEERYLIDGIEKYLKRIKHYIALKIIELPEIKDTKNLSHTQQKDREAELILKHLVPSDHVVLLDEGGDEFTSVAFSQYLSKKMLASVQNLVFIVGGPYGFDKILSTRSNEKISLSRMTFSHQMVRLFFVEQVYRALTILKGEPYHHQ